MVTKKLLVMCSAVLMMVGIVFASQPLFQGQYTIDGVDGATNTGWRLTGTFEDASLLGFSASDATTNDRIFVYSSFGDLDLYKITNIVSVAGSSLSVDVIYDETGTPRAGAPVPGIQIMCRPGYDGYASFLPSLTFGQFTEYLQNGARNLNLKYAIMYAASNGIQGATISAGAFDSVVTNNKILAFTWNTNAVSGGGGTVNGVAITYDEGTTNYASVSGNTNIHVSFKTNYSSGTGTITNMLSSDSSIVWSEAGGPQPDGSVTAYVAGAISGLATGMPVYAETDPVHTNWLATNTYVKAETDPVWASEKGGYATGTPLYVESYLGTITGGTIVTGATASVTTNNGVLDFVVPSGGGGGGGSGFPLTNDVDLAGFTMSNGSFVGNGAGLTNITGTDTNYFAIHDGSNITWRVDGTNYYPDLNPAVPAATNALNTRMGATEAATNNLNTVKLNASATNALAVTALQIMGGSPTNGAVWAATNTVGQGTWKRKLVVIKGDLNKTTNNTPLVITGVGFRPSGATVMSAGGASYGIGFQFVDGLETSASVYYIGINSPTWGANLRLYTATDKYQEFDFNGFSDDGATWLRTTYGSPADLYSFVEIMFFP